MNSSPNVTTKPTIKEKFKVAKPYLLGTLVGALTVLAYYAVKEQRMELLEVRPDDVDHMKEGFGHMTYDTKHGKMKLFMGKSPHYPHDYV